MIQKSATEETELLVRINNYYFKLKQLEFEQKILNPAIEKLADLIYQDLTKK